MKMLRLVLALLACLGLALNPALAAWTGPTLLGFSQSSSGATSKSITGVTASAGSLVVFCGTTFTASTVANMSASDSAGNTWTFRGRKSASQNMNTWIAWSVLTSPLSSGSITVSSSTNNLLDMYMGAAAWTGQAAGPVEDTSVQADASTALTTSPSVTSGTPSATGDLMIGVMGEYLATADTYTEDTANGWTTIYHGVPGGGTGHMGCAYQVNAGSGAKTYNPTVGSAASNQFSLVAGGFLVGTGGGGGGSGPGSPLTMTGVGP